MVQSFKRRLPQTYQRRAESRNKKLDDGEKLYGYRWERLSKAWIQNYPFCILCLCEGELNRCIEGLEDKKRLLIVDHIAPHKGDSNLFYDQDNWQTLGKRHHDIDKQHCERSGKDWIAMLRQIIHERGTQAFLKQNAQWIPDGLLSRLIDT